MEKLIDAHKYDHESKLAVRESAFSWKNIKSKFGKIYAFFYGNPPAIIGGFLLSIVLAGAIFAPALATHDPERRVARPHVAPNAEHVLGSTRSGRDVYSQVLYGARKSLTVALTAGVIAMSIAVLVGVSSGYFGGKIDERLNFLTNVFLVFPQLPLLIVLAAFLGQVGSLVITVLLGITSWPWGARVIRAQTMAIRSKEFIISAEVMGESKVRIILVEILPNLISIVFGGFLGTVIYAMGAEAGLGILGLGDATEVSWGSMLYWAQTSSSLYTGAWWEMLVPAMALAITGGALALINMSIDQVSNPKLRTGPHIKLWHKLKKEADKKRGLR
ncbi:MULTISPECIES: ABC transporter permease [Vibrio]|jgi:peptide/nickel transport system permease protein|uniref:ABC transporter permease n=1 Tax=Vibrio mediterranei TaxID=689 RepID=A0ABX5DEA4_9VIBR|nr:MULTISPECIES: ABC transporter permease [Vibrio]MCG9658506.1 ABC transporter permease [Vibrio mediterranei]MCG9662868.1 ABC transporter permease [Vibrio mediterranei]OIN26636.1 peptide ABC transporter permease [Vibrio barjaei]PCD88498.1 ABC transporter permease [Vibrio mediterranei]PRQ66636.1 ABC transporter permease [Vibrio mediterranei]